MIDGIQMEGNSLMREIENKHKMPHNNSYDGMVDCAAIGAKIIILKKNVFFLQIHTLLMMLLKWEIRLDRLSKTKEIILNTNVCDILCRLGEMAISSCLKVHINPITSTQLCEIALDFIPLYRFCVVIVSFFFLAYFSFAR